MPQVPIPSPQSFTHGLVAESFHYLDNRVAVTPDCVTKFNELKLGKSIKYIIYKLSDDYKEIVVEESSTDPEWENFQKKIVDAKSSYKGKEGKGPRYAVYDFQYELDGGEGTRYGSAFFPRRGSVFGAEEDLGTRLYSFRGRPTRELWSSYVHMFSTRPNGKTGRADFL